MNLYSEFLDDAQRDQLYELSQMKSKDSFDLEESDLLQIADDLEWGGVRIYIGMKKTFKRITLNTRKTPSRIGVFYRNFYWTKEVSLLVEANSTFLFYSEGNGRWMIRSGRREIGRFQGSVRKPVGFIQDSPVFRLKFPFFAGLFNKACVELLANGRQIPYRKGSAIGGLFLDNNWLDGLKSEEANLILLCLLWRESYYLSTNW